MNSSEKVFTPRVLFQLLLFIVAIPLLPVLLSRRWRWREGWAYALVNVLGFVVSRALAARRHPDLLGERARTFQHGDAKAWDKVLVPLIGLGGGLLSLVVGLDACSGRSATYSPRAKLAALGAILAGFALGGYALVENRFFSGMVRIQTERDHQVISSGPYSWVRHPGYAGALLTYLATPIFLESAWAWLPAGFLSAVLIVRTYLEDRTLQEELDGYRAYARRVRYRLLPGVW